MREKALRSESERTGGCYSKLVGFLGELKKWVELALKVVSRGGLEPPTG
jgi:hypothetical protein